MPPVPECGVVGVAGDPERFEDSGAPDTGYAHPHLQVLKNNYTGLLHAMGRSQEEIMATLRGMDPELFGG